MASKKKTASTVKSAKKQSAKTGTAKKQSAKSQSAKPKSAKSRSTRDAPQVPTAKQIDLSLTRGSSQSLTTFLNKVKL